MQEATFFLLYKLNEKAITEKYCVNKNVKNSCCKGKCHLNKTIAKSENESRNPFSVLNLKVKEVEIYLQQFFQVHEVCNKTDISFAGYGLYFNAHLLEGVSAAPIKPPTVLG